MNVGIKSSKAAPGEVKFLSPDQKLFHISTNPTTREQERRFPESMPLRKVWNPQPNCLLANWLRLMEPARIESTPSGQRRCSAAPRGDRLPSPGQNPSTSLELQHPGHENADPRSIPPRNDMETIGLVADWLGLMQPAGGEGCPSSQGRGCAAHGKVKVPSPDQTSFHTSTVSTNQEPRW